MKRSSWIIAIVTSACIIGTGLGVLYLGVQDPVWHEVGPVEVP